jgi:hypothetical protein
LAYPCAIASTSTITLLADQAIVDRSANPAKYSKYGPGPACDELLRLHANEVEASREPVRRTVQALLPLQPDHLELIATLDFAFLQLKAGRRGSPSREEVLRRFHEIKGGKFPQERVAQAYDRLVEAQLLE